MGKSDDECDNSETCKCQDCQSNCEDNSTKSEDNCNKSEDNCKPSKCKDGKDGKNGKPGPCGAVGPRGPMGPRGEKGEKGESCKCEKISHSCIKKESKCKSSPKEKSVFIWAITENCESSSCSSTFKNIIFSQVPEICGWIYNKRTGSFTCNHTGKYLVTYNTSKKILIIGTINDEEIDNSSLNSFIIDIKKDDIFNLKFKGNTSNDIEFSVSLTIINIKQSI